MLSPLPTSEARKLRTELTRELLSGSAEFSLGALARKGWIAVPVRDWITDEQATLIAAAAQKVGVQIALSVTTSPKAEVEANRVPLTEEGILEFDANCKLRPFLLVSEGREFAILHEGDYYYLIAGTPGFVEEAVEGSIEDARAAFETYARAARWRKERQWLLELAERYAPGRDSLELQSHAPPGSAPDE